MANKIEFEDDFQDFDIPLDDPTESVSEGNTFEGDTFEGGTFEGGTFEGGTFEETDNMDTTEMVDILDIEIETSNQPDAETPNPLETIRPNQADTSKTSDKPKIKKGLFGKKKQNISDEVQDTDKVEEPIRDAVLYMITDKPIPGLLEYLRETGLNVTDVFSDLDTARGHLLMQSEPTRVVIVDTGTGKFITTTIRRDLIDMIGVNDEDTKFTVFYTDTLLKTDAAEYLGKANKNIEWIKYENTVVLAASMLNHRENYIIDNNYRPIKQNETFDILKHTGQKFPGETGDNIGAPIIQIETIYKNVVDTQAESIRKFNPRI